MLGTLTRHQSQELGDGLVEAMSEMQLSERGSMRDISSNLLGLERIVGGLVEAGSCCMPGIGTHHQFQGLEDVLVEGIFRNLSQVEVQTELEVQD